jgi:hypothetical protein
VVLDDRLRNHRSRARKERPAEIRRTEVRLTTEVRPTEVSPAEVRTTEVPCGYSLTDYFEMFFDCHGFAIVLAMSRKTEKE